MKGIGSKVELNGLPEGYRKAVPGRTAAQQRLKMGTAQLAKINMRVSMVKTRLNAFQPPQKKAGPPKGEVVPIRGCHHE
jgi:hypothetical protein